MKNKFFIQRMTNKIFMMKIGLMKVNTSQVVIDLLVVKVQ